MNVQSITQNTPRYHETAQTAISFDREFRNALKSGMSMQDAVIEAGLRVGLIK